MKLSSRKSFVVVATKVHKGVYISREFSLKILNGNKHLNFHPFEVVSRCRDSQRQVEENTLEHLKVTKRYFCYNKQIIPKSLNY